MWEFTLKKPMHAFVTKKLTGEFTYYGRLVNGKLITWNRAFRDFGFFSSNDDKNWEYVGDISVFYLSHEDCPTIEDAEATANSTIFASTVKFVENINSPKDFPDFKTTQFYK